jgi:hypothetical protein
VPGRHSRWQSAAVPALICAVAAAIAVIAQSPWSSTARPVAVRSVAGPRPTMLTELVDRSSFVVIGRVTSVQEGRLVADPGGGAIRTQVLEVETGAVLAGPDPGRHILVEEEVSLADGTPIVVDGLRPSRQGDEGFWFCIPSPDGDVPYVGAVGVAGRLLFHRGDAGDDRLQAADDPLAASLASLGGRRLTDDVIAVARSRGREIRTP